MLGKIKSIGFLVILVCSLCVFWGCDNNGRNGVNGEFSGLNEMLSKYEEKKALEEGLGASTGGRRGEVLIGSEIYRAMIKNGITNLISSNISHLGYRKVNEKWVTGEFSKKYREFLFNQGVLNWYEEGQFNCEDYSLGASFYARVLNRLSDDRIKGISIAVGIIYYVPDMDVNNPRHSINFMILEDESIVFYEPQYQQIVKLSKNEINSIYYWEL